LVWHVGVSWLRTGILQMAPKVRNDSNFLNCLEAERRRRPANSQPDVKTI
jgi:hypothetical protein